MNLIRFLKGTPIENWRSNCLNTVRLLAALSVMYGHVRIHLNVSTPPLLDTFFNYFFGVPIFFAMSGFLIWGSIKNSRNFKDYAAKRFWRIYPELWCGVVLEILSILLLFKKPIQWLQLGLFTLTQGTILQFWTPDFLREYGCGTPNGSLWTICVIIQFYFVIFFIHRLLHKKGRPAWAVAIGVSVFIGIASPYLSRPLPEIVYKLYNQTLFPYLWLFMMGALIAEYKEKIVPILKRLWPLLLVVSFLFFWTKKDIPSGPYGYSILRCSTLFAGLLGFSYSLPKLNIKWDISYGIYIYHMIVVNGMISFGLTERFWHLILAMAVSCILAWISYYFSKKLIAARQSKK